MLRLLEILVLSIWLGSSLIVSVQAGELDEDWERYLNTMEQQVLDSEHFTVAIVVNEQRGEMLLLSPEGKGQVGTQVIDGQFSITGGPRCSDCGGGGNTRTVCIDLQNDGSLTPAFICSLDTINFTPTQIGGTATVPNDTCADNQQRDPNSQSAGVNNLPNGQEISFVVQGDLTILSNPFAVRFSLSNDSQHFSNAAATVCDTL